MWQGIGIAGVFAVVWLGYTIEGGHFGVVMEALGPEMLIIGGSGVMTLFISNDVGTVKKVAFGLKKIFSGAKWKKGDYKDALCLMFLLVRVARQEGNVALERHIEAPKDSAIFSRYPRLLSDNVLVGFVSDVFRSITLNFTDAHKVGEMMEAEVEKIHHEQQKAAKALNSVADAFPALGIVAAVLGVIHAMGAISEPPEVLGRMIGSALVGTFLGVFLSYAMVGPMAARIKGVIDEERAMAVMISLIITSHLDNLGPQLAVEVGRKLIPTKFQPSFLEMDEMLKDATRGGAARA